MEGSSTSAGDTGWTSTRPPSTPSVSAPLSRRHGWRSRRTPRGLRRHSRELWCRPPRTASFGCGTLSLHELLHDIGLDGDFAKGLAFVDDSRIAIGTQRGLIAVLTLDPDELAAIGRSRLSRGFTEEECMTYLGLEECPSDETEAFG